MPMITMNAVEAILNSGPALDSVEYRNAWATVAARVARTKLPNRHSEWMALADRMAALGEPVRPRPMDRADALQRAQNANEARVAGRSRAAILRRIEDAQFKRIVVAETKPWLFEVALQMVEDHTVGLHSFTHDFPERGPEPEGGRQKVRRLVLCPYDPTYARPCPWVSRKKQAEEEARI